MTTAECKEIAFDNIDKALDFLTDYFNQRSNQATDADFYKLNATRQKFDFLEKLMITD